MAIDVTLLDVTSGFNLDRINANFEAVETALADAISRSGSTPNQMEADLDLNSYDILNGGSAEFDSLIINGVDASPASLVNLPMVANTYLKRSSDNLSFDTLTSKEVSNDIGAYYFVNTLASLKALSKSSLSDGETLYVKEDLVGGWFKWFAASVESADGGVIISSDEGGAGRWVRQFNGDPWVEWWGAKATRESDRSWSTQNGIAFNAAAAYAKTQRNGIVLNCRSGFYWIDQPINTVTDSFFRRIGFRGNGPDQTVLFANFVGAGLALLDGRHPTGLRVGGIVLENLKVQVNNGLSGPKPLAWAQSKSSLSTLTNVQFVGDFTNTVLDITGEWNGDYNNVSVWQAGHFRGHRKVNAAARFSATVNTNTITATGADVWLPGDEGTVFFCGETPGRAGRYTIGTVVGPREITVVETIVEDMTNAYGWFDGVLGTINTASNSLALSAPVGEVSDIGRLVVLRKGLNGPNGTRKALVATILDVPDASTFILDKTPDHNLGDVTVYLSPAILLRDDDTPGGTEVNDARLQIALETHAGLGMYVQGTHLKMRDIKIHGRGLSPGDPSYPAAYDDEIAQASLLLDNVLIGDIDHLFCEQYCNDDYRVYVDGLQVGLAIDRANFAMVENQLLIHASGCASNATMDVGPRRVTSGITQSSLNRALITTDKSMRAPNVWGTISFSNNAVPGRLNTEGGFDAVAFGSDGGRPITIPAGEVRSIPIPEKYLFWDATNAQRSGLLFLHPTSNANHAVELFIVQNVKQNAGDIKIWRQLGSVWEVSTNDLDVTPGNNTKITAGLHVAGGAPELKINNRTASSITLGWHWAMGGRV